MPRRMFEAVRLRSGSPLKWWALVLAGLSYGLITALALPPVNIWPLAFAALVPLVWAACRLGKRPAIGALWVGLGTLPFWTLQHVWLINVTPPGYPVLAVYLSLSSALCVWMVAQARNADWPIPLSVVVPLMVVAVEFLRGEIILTGYAWFMAGHPLIASPVLAAPAALLGAYFVSFLCGAFAGAVADASGWSGIDRKLGGIGAAVLVVLWGLSSWSGERSTRPQRPVPAGELASLRVAVVQTNLPQDNKMSWPFATRREDMRRFVELSKAAAAMRPAPEVIIWPETMFPGIALNSEAVDMLKSAGINYTVRDSAGVVTKIGANVFHDELVKLQAEINIPMVIGCAAIDGNFVPTLLDPNVTPRSLGVREYNSAIVVERGQVTSERYDKVELTPFGEMIPYLWRWPDLQQWVLDFGAKGMAFNLAMGTKRRSLLVHVQRSDPGQLDGAIPIGEVRIATPICFEGTRAGLVRSLVTGGDAGSQPAQLIVNMSNDGWFSFWNPGRAQHQLASQWRSVELGVPMVRAVNTGMSGVIDRRGRLVHTEVVPVKSSIAAKPDSASGATLTEEVANLLPKGLARYFAGNAQTDGVLIADVPLGRAAGPTSLFSMVGQWPMAAVAVLGGVASLVFWRRRQSMTEIAA